MTKKTCFFFLLIFKEEKDKKKHDCSFLLYSFVNPAKYACFIFLLKILCTHNFSIFFFLHIKSHLSFFSPSFPNCLLTTFPSTVQKLFIFLIRIALDIVHFATIVYFSLRPRFSLYSLLLLCFDIFFHSFFSSLRFKFSSKMCRIDKTIWLGFRSMSYRKKVAKKLLFFSYVMCCVFFLHLKQYFCST